MAARQNVQKEWKLLSYWLATYHPLAEIWMNVRVGPNPPLPQGFNPTLWDPYLARVLNRWADAVYLESGTLNLVEAKMSPDPGIFSRLVHYGRKLRLDPNFSQYAGMQLNLIALVASDDPSVAMEAPWYGVQWILYQPSYLTSAETAASGFSLPAASSPLPQDFPARVSLITSPQR